MSRDHRCAAPTERWTVPGTRREFLSVLAGSALVLTIGGCSGPRPEGPGTVIHHSKGSTTVPPGVNRIVTLGSQWTDALTSLGVTPVAHLDNVRMSTGAPAPWRSPTLEGVPEIDPRGDVVEQIAPLGPDLILAPGFAADQRVYDGLSGIAPTIPGVGEAQVTPWRDVVTLLGTVLDKPREADEVIASVTSGITALGQEFPAIRGKTVALAYLFAMDRIMVLADPADGAATLLAELGMSMPEALVSQAGGAGRFPLGTERVRDLDADVLVVASEPQFAGTLQRLPGYADLRSVRSGAVAELDTTTVTALNLPTPLSVPRGLQALRPALARVG